MEDEDSGSLRKRHWHSHNQTNPGLTPSGYHLGPLRGWVVVSPDVRPAEMWR